MEKTPVTLDFPLRPVGAGETLVHVFRTAAEQSAADQEDRSPGPHSVRDRPNALPPLQRRLYEADGRPVRLGGYDVHRSVGSGGMGIVYEAVSVPRGHRVALKTLRWMTAQGLARFKSEFRGLAAVSHPNLISLYDLGVDQGEWFFTMELVVGHGFLEHVQAEKDRPPGGWDYLGETLTDATARASIPIDAPEPPAVDRSGVLDRRTFHEGRLRTALRQLASGVASLHQLGKLHRDLNPGNVLVTREGRVVVLDFGLITDRVRRPGFAYDGASGTPAYMSPEQAAGKPATAASDWYGFGVMLFEALTGQLPFSGSTLRMLTNKRLHAAPTPSELLAGLPDDLDTLCAALLRRAPEARPTGDEVLEALGAPTRRTRVVVPGDAATFTGRSAEIAALEAALAEARERRPAAVAVLGSAGMGKSSVLSRFLDAQGAAGVTIVRGACHEREDIPLRLLDAAMDSLAVHLGSIPVDDLRALFPPGGRELARTFPVIEGALPPDTAPCPEAAPDETALRCLRELVARLAGAQTMVIAVDDAHLGDVEGARWLATLGSVPGVLLVVAFAAEEAGACPVLAELARALPEGALRRVVVGPLALAEATALARHVLPEGHGDAEALGAASAGCPLAVVEICQHVADRGGRGSLDEAVAARLTGLPESAFRLAEAAALAGQPERGTIARGALFAAAEAGPTGDHALAVLAASRVIRSGGVRDEDRVRIHDPRILAVLAARTSPAEARRIQLELGRAILAQPGGDPAEAAERFVLAGEAALAASHLSAAAERAAARGDPDTAARLLAHAVALAPSGSDLDLSRLKLRRAEALAAAGRGAAAGSAYLDAAVGAAPSEVRERRRLAAEHLLLAGHAASGIDLLRTSLAAHDRIWPEAKRAALLRLGAGVVELRLRGADLGRLGHARTDGRPGARGALDALWSGARGLWEIDPLRSAVLAIETLHGALAEGEAAVAGPALAFVGSLLTYPGSPGDEARGLALVEEAARFARAAGDPHLLGFSWLCSAVGRLSAGRWREALARANDAMGLLEGQGAPPAWERHAYRAVCLAALHALGSLRERARRAETWLHDAERREDRAGQVQANLALALRDLGAGDTASAEARAAQALATADGASTLSRLAARLLQVSISLYAGDPRAAQARLRVAWPDAEILRIQRLRVELLLLRGATAVASKGAVLHEVDADAASLEREGRPHAQAAAALLRAGAAARRGQVDRAVSSLAAADRTYTSAEMTLHAAAARRTRGAFLGGEEGRALVSQADAALAAEGVQGGARWAAMVTGIADPALVG